MSSEATAAAEQIASHPRTASDADAAAPAFPGCRPVPLPREQLATYDGRYEFWDGATETAWEVRDAPTATHELPAGRLVKLAGAICDEAGVGLTIVGTVALVERGLGGRAVAAAQADQALYIRPETAFLPTDALTVGLHDFPDVLLEVDFTTDVHAGKLDRYAEWGVPEVWVEVPDRRSRNARPGVWPGLTIHLLGHSGAYTPAECGRAFPGWTAAEIHAALNEDHMSFETIGVLRRVGRELGQRYGSGPDDGLWLGTHRAEARADGIAQSRLEMVTAAVEVTFGRDASTDIELGVEDLSGVGDTDIFDALRNSLSAAEFMAELRRRQRHRGR